MCCGAECGVSNTNLHFVTVDSASISTSTVRTGARSFRINPTAGTGLITKALTSTTNWVFRLYVYFAVLPSVTSSVVTVLDAQGVYFKASDSSLYVGSSTIVLGLTGVAITTGQWYRIDLKTTATTLDAQVDGVSVGQLVGVFSANANFRIGDQTTANTRDQFVDDIVISQTLADYPIGAGFVKSYIPNADGAHNVAGAADFKKGTAGTPAGTDITNATTDAYQWLDDRPLPTTAVDFINGIAPPNPTDYVEWQYEDSTESDPPRAVDGIVAWHSSGTGTNGWTVTLREHVGATSATMAAETFGQVAVDFLRTQFATVPGTSDPWTTTKFNALRSRFLVSDAAPDPYIDAAMLEAEFPEAVAGPAANPPYRNPMPPLIAQ
jgi:hypothetical protein